MYRWHQTLRLKCYNYAFVYTAFDGLEMSKVCGCVCKENYGTGVLCITGGAAVGFITEPMAYGCLVYYRNFCRNFCNAIH